MKNMPQGDLNLNRNYRLRQSALIIVVRLILIELFFSLILYGFHFLIFEPGELLSLSTFIVVALLNLILLIASFVHWYFIYYVISTDAISKHQGALFKRVETYDLQSIRSVRVREGVIGKLFNYGDLLLDSPLLKSTVILKRIHDPMTHAEIIDTQRLELIEDKDIRNITPVI